MVTFRWAQASDAGLVHSITQDAWEEYRSLPGSSSAFGERQDQIYSTISNGTLAVLGFVDQHAVLSVRL